LSLVQAIARLHGSALELLDNEPGLHVRMVMPSSAGTVMLAERLEQQAMPIQESPAPA
jgi:hypothetical protein